MTDKPKDPLAPRSALVAGLLLTNAVIARGLSLVMLSILAALYGLSRELDVVLFAFTIPQLLGELGTEIFYSSLLPRLSALRSSRSLQESWAFSNRASNSTCLALALLSAMVWILSPLLVRLLGFGFTGEEAQMATRFLRIAAITPFLYACTSVGQAWLMAEGRVLAPSMKWSIGSIAGLLALLLFLRAGGGIVSYIYANLVAEAIASVVVILALVRGGPRAGYRFLTWLSLAEWKLLIRQMAPQLTVGLVPRALRLGERSAAAALGVGAISAITMARSISGLALMAANAVALGLFPALTRSAARGPNHLARHMHRGLAASLWGSVPMLIFLALQRVPLIQVLFARRAFSLEDVHRVAALVPWLLLAAGALGIASLLTRGFYAQERSGEAAVIHIVALVLYVPLVWLLSSSAGMHGLAAASAAMALLLTAGLLLCYRSLLAGSAEEWVKRAGKLGLAASLTSVICHTTTMLFSGVSSQGILANIALALAVPFLLSLAGVLLLALLLYPSETRDILAFRRRVRATE